MSDLLISMYEDLDKITDEGGTLITSSGIDEFMAKYDINNLEDMIQLLLQYLEYRREME